MPRSAWRIGPALATLALLAGAPAAHAAGQKLVKTSAHFAYFDNNSATGCTWGIGVVVGPVAGAKSYLIKYYDGYWKQLEVGTFTAQQLHNPDFPVPLFLGVTGGGYSPPCSTGGDPTENGRFSKGAKAWAIFPPNYKPKPSLKVKVDVPDGGVSVNSSIDVRVTVTAGPLALKDVSLGRGLQAEGGLADVTKRPRGLSGFSLGAGGSKTFSFTVKAKSPGAAQLSARGSGRSKRGSVSGQDSATLRIAKAELALTMGATPGKVELDVNDDGTVDPSAVGITVKLTNTGNSNLEGVSLQSLNPEPVTQGQRLDQLAFPHGTLPLDIGTIPAKSTVTKVLPLLVTGDGKYQIRALALYAAEGGGNGRVSAIGGKFEAVVPLIFFSAKRDPDNIQDRSGQPWITAGKTWYVTAKLKNESSYQRVCVSPISPNPQQNAAANGPVDILEKNLRDTGGPFAGAVGPGKTVTMQMFVDTAPGGPTASIVSLKPTAGRLGPDDKCDESTYKGLKKLGPADFHIPATTGTDFGVHVDVSTPVGTSSPGSFAINFLGGFTKNVFVDTVKGVLDLVALGHSAWSAELEYERLYPFTPPFAAAITIKSAQAIQVASDVYATYWKLATAQQKQGVLAKTAAVLSKTTNDFYDNAIGAVRDAAEPFMRKLEKAYATGDDAELGRLWGGAAGSAAQQVVVGMFVKTMGAQLAADTGELEAMAARAGREWEDAQGARALESETDAATRVAKETVPAGTVLSDAEKAGVWGLDAETDSALTRISKKFKALIGVRSRSPGSIAELKKGSVWKHENIKPKNVNDIDVEWLGFRRSDIDQVRFRTYTQEQIAAITNRVESAALTPQQKAAILKRLAKREAEAGKYLDKIEGFSKKGEINVGFNYRPNGIKKAGTRQIRRFKLEGDAISATGEVPAGGTYYTPLQENLDLYHLRKAGNLPANCTRALASVLCTITGDVDGVYVTRVDGSAIPQSELVDLYDELAAAGWQHAETTTWINDQGEFFFGDKADILKDLEVGGQAMVEYAPDGVTRATYLNLNGSSLIGSENYHLRVVGGYTDFTAAGVP